MLNSPNCHGHVMQPAIFLIQSVFSLFFLWEILTALFSKEILGGHLLQIIEKFSKKEENIMGGFDRAMALNKMKWKPNWAHKKKMVSIINQILTQNQKPVWFILKFS